MTEPRILLSRTDLPAAPYVTSQFELSLKLTEVGGRIMGGAEYATIRQAKETLGQKNRPRHRQ